VKFNEFLFPYRFTQEPGKHVSQLFKVRALPRLLKTVTEKSPISTQQVIHHVPTTTVQGVSTPQSPILELISPCIAPELNVLALYSPTCSTTTSSYDNTSLNKEAETQGILFFATSNTCLLYC